MEQGTIKIEIAKDQTPFVEFNFEKNNLWQTKYEIARLLGCFVQKIDAELKIIFKERLLCENDCIHCNRYIDNGLEKQTEYYNLDVLIFLCYRINTFEAKLIREFVKSALLDHLKSNKKPPTEPVLAYLPTFNYCLN